MIWLSRDDVLPPSQFDLMRQWLDALAADTSAAPQGEKVRRTRPAALGDDCFMAGGVRADLTCNGTWRHYGTPRIAAGAPLSLDVVKCRLKPLARADYGDVTFSDAQWAQLQAAFPTGVCDYSQPGVSQHPPKARWLTFADGPGGRALGPAPAAAEIAAGGVSGSVPATLALTLGAPAGFGAFAPGVEKDYTASTTADVVSTAGDAALRVSEPGRLTNGAFALPEPLRVELSKASWTAPVSHDEVAITFRQHIGPGDALRTGTYATTVTFTLSTTMP